MEMESKEQHERALCEFVRSEYEKRAAARAPFELQWRLNMNFVAGRQYCDISEASNEVFQDEKQYFWQEREVFNHIAPLIEVRLSRFSQMRPQVMVRPATGDEQDVQSAKVCTQILRSVYKRLNMQQKIADATVWSETCGTVFYKILWRADAGMAVAHGKKQGDVDVAVCSPYEIYPDQSDRENVEKCNSLIHAQIFTCSEIYEKYGVHVAPEAQTVYSMTGAHRAEVISKEDSALVMEYYEKPSRAHKNGRLLTVAGDKLLFEGELPYRNGESGERMFPFVQQSAIVQPGCFWGSSVVERCIPVQRAYNAVKNRKHEYLNRAAFGVVAVEEGAVDTEALENEGLYPGKVLIYKQGANPPTMMPCGTLPSEFAREEEMLLQEFEMISGISDLMRRGYVSAGGMSGTALSLINEQDNTRLSITAEHIRNAILAIARQWLRLYKQFASGPRLDQLVGENGKVSAMYWRASAITSDDVVHETENELSQSIAQRRQMVFDLLARGIFTGERGVMDEATKAKVLSMLGMGDWENGAALTNLSAERAQRENMAIEEGKGAAIMEADDHRIHLQEHSKLLFSERFELMERQNPERARALLEHVAQHRTILGGGADGE